MMKEYTVQGKKYRMQLFSDKINTHEQAYLIGYLLGDGGFNKATTKRQSRLFVSSIDDYIIEGMKNEFCPDTSISSRIPVNNTRDIHSNKLSYKLQFPSLFHETFKKYGVLSVKTERTYHNVSKELMCSLLLGLFDADGCVTWGHRKDRDRLWGEFLLVHPNLKMLEKLQKFLAEELSIISTVSPKGTENCYKLRFSKRHDVANMIKYMYSSKSKIKNITKYNNCMNFIKELSK